MAQNFGTVNLNSNNREKSSENNGNNLGNNLKDKDNNASLNFTFKKQNTISKGNNIIQNMQNVQSQNQNVSKATLVQLLDNLNLNKTSIIKDEGTINFRKKIDKLNLKFYMETNKYLTQENDMNKNFDSLFVILFKQITVYSEEVERLGMIVRDFRAIGEDSQVLNQLKKASIELQGINNQLKEDLKQSKLENESLKRQLNFFIEGLKLDLNTFSTKNSNLKLKDFKDLKDFKEVKELLDKNNIQGTQISHKKNISSDKLLQNIGKENKDKDKLSYKPTLSLTNFSKNIHTLSSSSNFTNRNTFSPLVNNTISDYITNTDVNQEKVKKRNLSENDPPFAPKIIKEISKDNADIKSKLSIQEVVKLNNATSSSSKKPLVFIFI